MKLSVELEKWRTDRPDEWKMDEFVRNAEKLETERDALVAQVEAGISGRESYYNEIAELEHLRDALAAKVVEVTAERDALASQVGTLLDELNASVTAILARNPSDEIHAIACSMTESAEVNPQQILAEVKAQAGRDGYLQALIDHRVDFDTEFSLTESEEISVADEYADSIRQEMSETDYLMASPENAERLMRSIQQVKGRK